MSKEMDVLFALAFVGLVAWVALGKDDKSKWVVIDITENSND